MPTARGWVFAMLSVLILGAGIVRDELGAVIWGGGVLLLETAVIVAGLLGRARLRSKRGEFAAEIEHEVVEAGATVPVRVTVPRLRLLPGFFLTHDLRLAWSTRVCARSVTVRPGTAERWDLAAGARGDFRSAGSALALRDVFGFTATRLIESGPKRLLVVPTDPGEDVALPASRGGEISSERSEARVRSDELREVRPYTPGDDLRLVSWKHLATYQEMLVRVGELIPPTRGRVEVTIDAHLPSGAKPPEAGDALMRTLRAIVRQASHSGVELLCRFPPRTEPVRLSEETLFGPAGDVERLEAAAAIAGFLPGHAPVPDDWSRAENPPGFVGSRAGGSPGSLQPRGGEMSASRSRGDASLLLTARPPGAPEVRLANVLSVSHLIDAGEDEHRLGSRPDRDLGALFLRESQ